MARNVSIKFSADVASYLSGVARAEAGTRQFVTRANSYVTKHDDELNKVSNTAGGIGAAVALGVGGAIKTYAGFDQKMSDVGATGDEARANIDGLRDAAIDMGAKTAFSANEAASGVENLLKAGVSAKEVLGGGLKGALDLAAAGSIEVSEASEIAATAMTQFKLSGKDVPHIADLLAAAAGKAQGEVSDMGAALGQSGLVASQFGLSIEDTTGTLAAFASNGLLGSDAGTSFKTMLLSLASPSKESTALMDQLGIAAYDAQGNFAGVTSLAEQLKTKLGPLSQAQRDAALSTIFGSDAIRAANVLYEQGGTGITSWIGKVNDAGYASETAATKLDNLNGDLEAFRGSAETALIGLGESGDGPLRSLVQGATDVLNAFTAMSDGTKGAILATAGSAAGLLLLAAGAGKVVIFANSARLAMVALGISARTATLSIPIIGVALAAVTAVVSHFASESQAAEQATTDYDSAIASMTGTVDKNTVALNGNVRATVAKRLQDAGVLDAASRLGLSLDTVTSATLGNKDAIAEYNAVLASNLALNPQLSAANADRYNDAVKLAQSANGEALAAAEATRKANQLKEATVQGGAAARGAAGRAGELAAAEKALTGKKVELKKATQDLKDETQKLIDKFTILRNGALDQESANSSWEASIDAVSDAVRGNRRDLDEQVKAGKLSKKEADARSRSLDDNTAAGRTNRKTIADAVTALNDKISADFKANVQTKGLAKATDIASAALKTGRKRIDESTTAAGLNKAEVKRMQDRMLLTPKELRTQVKTPGIDDARTKVDDLKTKIKALSDKKVTISFGTNASFKGYKVNLTAPSAVGRLAGGGTVRGVGGSTQDNVHGIDPRTGFQTADVSVGEEVIKERSAAANRTALKTINAGNGQRFEVRPVQALADGGTVSRALAVSASGSLRPLANAITDLDKGVAAWARGEGSRVGKAIEQQMAAAAAASSAGSSYSAAKAGKYGDLTLSGEQTRNAAIIASVGSGMGQKAVQVGLITAIQESMLRNLSGGDRDSVGLFQQRAPWGSKAARMDPRTSAGMFFHGGQGGQRGLDDIRGWQTMGLGGAAQAVQVSAFPGAYTKWIDEAKAIQEAMASAGSNASGKSKGGRAWPTTGRIISTYAGHDGVDINKAGGDYGEPIYAYRSGIITHAGPGKGYGNAVFEQPDVGPSVVYGHGSKVLVREGQRVSVGQQIAKVGSTGRSSGDHLHFGHPGGTYSQAMGMLRGLAEGGIVKGGSGGVTARVGEGRFDELVTPLPPGWNMSKPDSSAVQKLITALENPLKELIKATRVVAVERQRYGVEQSRATQPRQYLYDTTKRNIQAKVARDDLREDVTWLRKKATATKGVTWADRALAKAHKDLRAAEIAVTTTGEKRARAQEQFTVVAERAREAADRLKEAQQALAAQQQAVADSARAVSATMAGRYTNSAVTDPAEIIAQKRAGAAELNKFNAQIQRLRKSGLNESSISEIVDRGPVGGGELAIAILSAGQGLIKALNGAQANLTRAADNIGLTVATGVQRKAGGGPVLNLSGKGRPGQDTEFLLAGVDEHMWTSQEVAAAGGHNAVARMRAAALQGADRGIVDRNYSPRRDYGGTMQQRPQTIHHRPVTVNITMPETGNWESAASGLADRIAADLAAMGL